MGSSSDNTSRARGSQRSDSKKLPRKKECQFAGGGEMVFGDLDKASDDFGGWVWREDGGGVIFSERQRYSFKKYPLPEK